MDEPASVRTIPRLVLAAAHHYGDAPAVADGPVRRSFTELADDVRTAARGFAAQGIRPGDRVGLWAPNSHRWITASLGLQTAGAVVVPINTRYRGAEAVDVLARTEAVALVVEQGFLGYDHLAALAAEAAEVGADLSALRLLVDLGTGAASADTPPGVRRIGWDELLSSASAVSVEQAQATLEAVGPDDLSEIIFTSGTTGRSKGVRLTHGAALAVYGPYGRIWGLRPGDRYLVVLPLFHTGGTKAGLMTSLLHGVTIVPMAVFDPVTAMETIQRERITVMNGSPTIYTTILDHPDRDRYDLSSLRLAATGAAIVPQRLVERARTELPFENFITAYGLTECAGLATMCRATDSTEVVAATNGAAVPGVELRVVDLHGRDLPPGEPGEVLVRGVNVTRGYWRDPEATAAAIDPDGWLHTGDIGALDPAGNLSITDRLKDLFIVGGFNVSPAEVEQTMTRHPAISEVAVIGVPDHRLGEVVRAYVIPKPGPVPEPAEVIAWCRERMANFKVPREVVLVETLPRNASGKVLRRELRAAAEVERSAAR